MHTLPLSDVDPLAVETLLDRAFGPERHAKTAYRVRAGLQPIAGLSFAMLDGERPVATIQLWPVALACDAGGTEPMIMVGPVAVEPMIQRGGLGRSIMQAALAAAAASDDAGRDALMLVGDPEYYARWFDFTAARTSGWRLPGPWEPHRLLARGDRVPDTTGLVVPRPRGC